MAASTYVTGPSQAPHIGLGDTAGHPSREGSCDSANTVPPTGRLPETKWWQGSDVLPRLLADLISAEARRLRPADRLRLACPWAPATRLDESGLGFDSLERIQLAAALSELIQMHESGLADDLLARPVFGEWCATAAEALRRSSATLAFQTAGSTGTPKSCRHALAELEREVDAHMTALSGVATRVLSAVPCHHIYGFLFTVLLPQRLRVPVLDIRGHSPGALPALARQGDLIVGYPAFWMAVSRAAPSGWPAGVTGVTSTGPCPVETAETLLAGSLSRLLQIHGSSETAGIGWRDDARDPYKLLPYWERGAEGRLIRAALTGSQAAPTAVLAPDKLEWLDRSSYLVGARHDGAVQVGGVNVFADRVRDVLQEHPDVAAAAVRLMNPPEGLRLKAFIVPRSAGVDTAALRSALNALAAARLSAPEQPRAYTFGQALPAGPMGKAADWMILPDRDF